MNVLRKWHDIIDKWNEENKCGLCWEFKGGVREDYFNNLQIVEGKECCVYVGLFDVEIETIYNQYGVNSDYSHCELSFTMVAGLPSTLDIQMYNENANYPIEESKWEKYINPLLECLGCNIYNEFCENEDEIQPTQWKVTTGINYNDLNFDGVVVKATYRL